MIDVWLLACLAVPFAEVLLQTYLENKIEGVQDVSNYGSERTAANEENDAAKEDRCSNVGSFFVNKKVVKPANYDPPHDNVSIVSLNVQGKWAKPEEEDNDPKNKLSYRVAKFLSGKGLLVLFLIFTIIYFIVGACYYTKVLTQDQHNLDI